MEKIISSVRIRPVNSTAPTTNPIIINQMDSCTIQANRSGGQSQQVVSADKFTYDKVFGPEDSNQTVFDSLVIPLLDRAFKGFNICIFTYGQTSSGKTHTMKGVENDPGLIPRSIERIFKIIQESPEAANVEVSLDYVEIYNETINDLLLRGNSNLDLKLDRVKGLAIKNITNSKVSSQEEAIKLL